MNGRLALIVAVTIVLPLTGLAVLGECKVNQATNVDKTTQKYALEYQSYIGQDCRGYRVRNTAKGIFTPFLWTDGKETLLQGRVAAGSTDWVEAYKSTEKTDKGKTSLGYGLNEDECKEDVEAFRKFVKRGENTASTEECPTPTDDRPKENSQKESNPVLVTSLKGSFAEKNGRVRLIDITVKSSVTDKTRLVYEIKLGKKCERLRLASGKKQPDGVNLIYWASAQSDAFEKEVKRQALEDPLEPDKTLKIEFEAFAQPKKSDGLLIVVGSDGERLAATTAESYKPEK